MYKYEIKFKDRSRMQFESRHHFSMLQPVLDDVFYFDDAGVGIYLSRVLVMEINKKEHPVASEYQA